MTPQTLSQWLDWQTQLHPAGIALGLERVREVAARLHLPRPRRLVTIAGTNGKGTAAHGLDALAREAGWRTGRYTSPHLYRYNERICVDGCPAPDATLCMAFAAVEAARGATPLTYFEFGTLAALWVFAQQPLDLVILEVGLGGRLDATNILPADLVILTSLALDHQEWLGHTLPEIAREKAGVVHAGTEVVIADPGSAALYQTALPDTAAAVHVLSAQALRESAAWPQSLPVQSLAAALKAAQCLQLPLPAAAMPAVLTRLQVPGRCERRVTDYGECVLDVAHNTAAAERLAAHLATLPRMATALVIGMQADKDLAGCASALQNSADVVFACTLPPPRGATAAQIAAGFGARVQSCSDSPEQARVQAESWARAQAGAVRIIICGSFITVGECGLGG